ncbi:Putative transporter svop-1 [Durusdinium trenchii]|uniref:Transporter svop-1 n=1 Tax=Durusdinium trenchii TaxID=1381693 RepID=A0ABP0M9R3_9DINO
MLARGRGRQGAEGAENGDDEGEEDGVFDHDHDDNERVCVEEGVGESNLLMDGEGRLGEEWESAEDVVVELVGLLGFGRFQWMLFGVAGLGWAADVALIFGVGLIIPVLTSAFAIEPAARAGLVGSVTFGGMFVGSWVFGTLGDMVGRKPVFVVTSLLTSVFGLLSAMAPSFALFLVLRAAVGVFLGGNLPIDFSLFLEWTPLKDRDRFTILLTGWSIVATVFATGAGYLTLRGEDPPWRLFLALLSLPSALTTFCRPWVPESPRFLICAGQGHTCANALQHAAEMNSVELPSHLLDRLRQHTDVSGGANLVTVSDRSCVPRVGSVASQNAALFQGSQMRRVTVLLIFIWLCSSFAFYSFSTWAPTLMNAHGSEDNTYFILLSTTAFQVAGLWCAVVLNAKIGPARTLAIYLAVDGAAVLLFTAFSGTFAGMFSGYAAFNFGCSGFFGLLYLFTNLCFPTPLRTTGFGLCAAANRCGGVLAPVLAGLLYQAIGVPACVVFAGFFLAASALTHILARNSLLLLSQ